MMSKLIKWWRKEREGRAEEGTSQDICPINGGVITYAMITCTFWGAVLYVFWLSVGDRL